MLQDVKKIVKDFDNLSAQEVLEWVIEKYGDRVAIASSFGIEDVVLIDMAYKVDPKIKVFTIDTGRLPQETYRVMEKIREKYGISIKVYFPDTRAIEDMVTRYGPDLFYRSVDLRKLCCQVRKVDPLKRALRELDAWICGLRREQSVTRREVKKVEIDVAHNNILKVNPLADWTTTQLWKYVRENNVPYNELHDKGYPSIGCAPCTRAIKEGEDIRAGRWWWEKPEQKECGLHLKK